MKITFMGTGTSHGVPSVDCMMQHHTACPAGVCKASRRDVRHRRTRSSLLVQWDDKTVLIDPGPDFREQCLREKVLQIDAVLITHGHADHIFGIPDIRSYTRDKAMPFYGSAESLQTIRATFPYIFNPDTPVGGGIPKIVTNTVNDSFTLFGKNVTPIQVDHLQLDGCFGYRIGAVTYIPDIKTMADEAFLKCAGTQLLILNCLRKEREHTSHLILPESMALARRIAPHKCYFTHMSHDIHYKKDTSILDDWMDFSWDGLSLDI